MAVGGAGTLKETWWHTQIFLGDGFTLLRSFQNQLAFDALSMIGISCALWAAWKIAKADLIDTVLLKEARKELEKANVKQIANARSRYLRFITGFKPSARIIPTAISSTFAILVALYAMTNGQKGEYDPAIAKQLSTLSKKEKSQRLKARARLLGAVSLVCVGAANFVRPDPLSPSEKAAIYKLSNEQTKM